MTDTNPFTMPEVIRLPREPQRKSLIACLLGLAGAVIVAYLAIARVQPIMAAAQCYFHSLECAGSMQFTDSSVDIVFRSWSITTLFIVGLWSVIACATLTFCANSYADTHHTVGERAVQWKLRLVADRLRQFRNAAFCLALAIWSLYVVLALSWTVA